ncbi:glycoside hydrolase family 47 protein, partial [Gonapodya prolifera JEL478]
MYSTDDDDADAHRFSTQSSRSRPPLSAPHARLLSLVRKRRRSVRAHLASQPPLPPSTRPSQPASLERHRIVVLDMLLHSFHAYIAHAFPLDSLRPLSCSGVDDFGGIAITLLDSLDVLELVGEHELFAAAVDLVAHLASPGAYLDFSPIPANASDPDSTSRRAHLDVSVSVFETSIRALGGLLAAHHIALLPHFRTATLLPTYPSDPHLLRTAHLLARRLLPAFDSPTLMPYGSINLLRGVLPGETHAVCAACAGTLALEWRGIGVAAGDRDVEEAPLLSLLSLLSHRSPIGLLGGHLNISSGSWIHETATVGPDADSVLEYACKGAWAWGESGDPMAVWEASCDEMYTAVRNHLKHGLLHLDVHMQTGQLASPFFHSLAQFLPGLKIHRGDILDAQDELVAARGVSERVALANFPSVAARRPAWRSPHVSGGLAILPEQFDLRANGSLVKGRSRYPLRPEFIESVYHAYAATRDDMLLEWAAEYVATAQWWRVPCGYAGVRDVATGEFEDGMESFWMAETVKYLYLLFDPSNHFSSDRYVFTTEAHPIPVFERAAWDDHGNMVGRRGYARRRREEIRRWSERVERVQEVLKKVKEDEALAAERAAKHVAELVAKAEAAQAVAGP